MVDLVGRATVESLVRAVPVVPDHEQRKLPSKTIAPIRNDQSPRALALDGSDQTLDHGDAAVLADRAEPLSDAMAVAPFREAFVGELDTLVGDEMPWLSDGQPQGSSQKGSSKKPGKLQDRRPN